MATIAIQEMAITGLEATYEAANAGGDVFSNDGRTFYHVKNGGGSPINVTITSNHPSPPPGTDNEDVVVAVTNGEERMIGPVNQKGYNNASGQAEVSYSAVTSVTVAAIRLPQ
jgi:hypothetical protein